MSVQVKGSKRCDDLSRALGEAHREIKLLTGIVNDRQERGNEMLARAEKADAEIVRLKAAASQRDAVVEEVLKAWWHWNANGMKPAWIPRFNPSTCKELLSLCGINPDDVRDKRP
jgi:hypothetical protein